MVNQTVDTREVPVTPACQIKKLGINDTEFVLCILLSTCEILLDQVQLVLCIYHFIPPVIWIDSRSLHLPMDEMCIRSEQLFMVTIALDKVQCTPVWRPLPEKVRCHFLVADTQLYKRLCPSVGLLVCCSDGLSVTLELSRSSCVKRAFTRLQLLHCVLVCVSVW